MSAVPDSRAFERRVKIGGESVVWYSLDVAAKDLLADLIGSNQTEAQRQLVMHHLRAFANAIHRDTQVQA